MRQRTFIAVAASPEIQRSASNLAAALRRVAGDVKWVAAENLHWTLQFLGEVEQLDIPEVCAGVAAAVAPLDPLDLAAYGAGAFPSPEKPRTLWLGAAAGSDPMIALQAAVQRELSKLGFRGEQRRYMPHLTLGRVSGPAHGHPHAAGLAEEIAALADFDAGSMLVDEVTIYASRLGRNGPAYEILGHAELGR